MIIVYHKWALVLIICQPSLGLNPMLVIVSNNDEQKQTLTGDLMRTTFAHLKKSVKELWGLIWKLLKSWHVLKRQPTMCFRSLNKDARTLNRREPIYQRIILKWDVEIFASRCFENRLWLQTMVERLTCHATLRGDTSWKTWSYGWSSFYGPHRSPPTVVLHQSFTYIRHRTELVLKFRLQWDVCHRPEPEN